MNEELAAAVRSLHDSLVNGIATDESLAQECALMAALAEEDGNQGLADTLRVVGRTHRVRALELHGKRALLNDQFKSVLQPEEKE